MRTRYDREHGEFTEKAHRSARTVIYPSFFKTPVEQLDFIDTVGDCHDKERSYDYELGIDRIIHVKGKYDLKGTLKATFQERFREPDEFTPKFRKQVTITEWNKASDLPSELSKIEAQWFTYGFYDDIRDSFLKVLVFNVPALIYAMIREDVTFEREMNKKNQEFLAINEDELLRIHALKFRYENGQYEHYSHDAKDVETRMKRWVQALPMKQQSMFFRGLFQDSGTARLAKPYLQKVV